MLICTPSVRYAIVNKDATDENEAFKNLRKLHSEMKLPSVEPINLMYPTLTYTEMYRNNVQQDASEFLSYLFSLFEVRAFKLIDNFTGTWLEDVTF